MSKEDIPLLLYLITGILFIIALWLLITNKPEKVQLKPVEDSGIVIRGNFLVPLTAHYKPPMIVRAVVTAYNPVPEQTDDTPHITASGERVREGIVACPVWLEFGTIVEIDGKLYECQDRMNPRYWNQNRFDILMWDYWKAIKFGKQIKVVKIY